MQGRRLDPGDIFRAASQEIPAPEGLTRPGAGVVLGPGGTRPQRTLVDEHERLHMELNGCNAFGLLLSVVGVGAIDLPEDERVRLLVTLVESCRNVHEVYATAISTWAMPPEQQRTALASYPDYVGYLTLGEQIAQGRTPGSMVATALVVGACVSSMQVPVDQVRDGQLLSAGFEVPDRHRPDARLLELVRAIGEGCFDFSWIEQKVDERWCRGSDPDPYGSPGFKQAYHETVIRIYHQFGWRLSRLGYPVLPWDGHLQLQTVDTVLVPGDFSEQHLSAAAVDELAAATAERSNAHHAVRSSERQSLHRPSYGERVTIRPPTMLEEFTHSNPAPGLHLIARPVESVVAAYGLTEDQAGVLRGAAMDGILTAARKMLFRPEGVLTFLGPLRSSADLRAMVEACIADRGIPPSIVSSTSVSCLFHQEWAREWVVPLRLATHAVLLYDLPPSLFLALEEASSLRFAPISFEKAHSDDRHVDPLQGVAVECTGAVERMDRWTAFLGSSVLMTNFAARLADLGGVIADRLILRSPLGSAMYRLAHEEPELAFSGLERSGSPPQIREPAVGPAAVAEWHLLRRRFAAHQLAWKRALN